MSDPGALVTPPPGQETSSSAEALEIEDSTNASDARRGAAQSKLWNAETADDSIHGSLAPGERKDDESTKHQHAEPPENGFIRLNTHDTSFVDEHIPSIEKFGQDLQVAINAAWPTRNRSRYDEAHVLLLSWEDDNLGVEREIRRLKHVFSNLYRFDVQEFRIPSKTPGKATTSRLSSFLENDSPSSLLIVYYAGHARLSNQTNEPPIWSATDKIGSPTLPCGGVQQLLEEAASDVLLLYDSCHSSHPAINTSGQGVTEVIAACGFETQAPAVGPHSFTNSLIRELEEAFTGPAISVAELHVRVIGSLKNWKPELLRDKDGNLWTDENGKPRFECHKRRTPVHCFLTNETPYRSIMLGPLPSRLSHAAVSNIGGAIPQIDETTNSTIPGHSRKDSGNSSSTVPTIISESSQQDKSLQVLLAIRLDDNYFLDGSGADEGKKLRTWCEWLKTLPSGAKDISVQGVYKSFSTLVLLNMPLLLWNLLPSNSAYSFVGFVQCTNLAHHLLEDGSPSKEDVKIPSLLGDSENDRRPVDSRGHRTSDSFASEVEIALAQSALDIIKNSFSQAMERQAGDHKAALEKPEVGIKFTDAVGRKFAIPFSIAKTWEGMEELIRQAFLHVEGLGPHVAEGHYDIIGPNGDFILPSVWQALVQPGWKASMHMWPMPTPPKAMPPHHRSQPNKPHFPPTPASSIFSYGDRSLSRPRGPPPAPSQPPPPPPPPPPVVGTDSKFFYSAPVEPDSSHQQQHRPLFGNDKKPTEKDQKESQFKKSSGDTKSSVSDDEDSAMKIVSRFMRVRKVFKVGRMGHGNNRETYFQISPKKEGLSLLNEYGRKLVDEAMKTEM